MAYLSRQFSLFSYPVSSTKKKSFRSGETNRRREKSYHGHLTQPVLHPRVVLQTNLSARANGATHALSLEHACVPRLRILAIDAMALCFGLEGEKKADNLYSREPCSRFFAFTRNTPSTITRPKTPRRGAKKSPKNEREQGCTVACLHGNRTRDQIETELALAATMERLH